MPNMVPGPTRPRSPIEELPNMAGPHEFHVCVRSNDPAEPELVLVARSDWGP
jgi:hypothetical protein